MCTQKNIPHKKDKNSAHDQEHANWNRRSFMQTLGLAGAGSMVLGATGIAASKPSPISVALSSADNDRVLVIVRLKGGNDGLNTIVPVYAYDEYANLRPTIRHQENTLLHLDDQFALPDYMQNLESVWGDGNMKVVHGVGYQQQNLSHFRSSEIWASAEENAIEPTGWWGRYYEDLYPDYLINPPSTPPAIQIGSVGNLIFEGTDNNYAFTVANPQQLATIGQNGTLHNVQDLPGSIYGDKLKFMRATTNTTSLYSKTISDAYLAATNQVDYGQGQLAKQLAIVSRMIKGGLGTKIYMVTLDGFDTHANQKDDHRGLLEDLSDSMKDFYDDLGYKGIQDEVLTMTISEFGRRPSENGSNGTDHGAASPVMLFGSGLNGSGFVGQHPEINEWDSHGNLIPTTDFQDIYATVLKDWFCLDSDIVNLILLNNTYETLDLGFSCNTLGSTDYSDITRFTHIPIYGVNRIYIRINMPFSANIDIKLYDMSGKEICNLYNGIKNRGEHKIDVSEKINARTAYGQYIYRIAVNGQFYSKSILIR